MDNLAPIVLFVYNRLEHTRQTVEALQKNGLAQESELFIYSDEAKNDNAYHSVNKVREYIEKIDGFKKVTIIKREKNWGLANSIIDGVTTIVNKYGKIIVLEDDLVTSPYFLKFMNEALEFYKNNNSILSIAGYSFPKEVMNFPESFKDDVYLHIRPISWSWATWKNRWNQASWDMNYFDEFISDFKEINKFNQGGKDLTLMLLNQKAGLIDSWYVRWCYHAFKMQQYTVYPRISMTRNIGFDNSGVHGKATANKSYFHSELENKSQWTLKKDVKFNKKLIKNFNSVPSPRLRTRISLMIRLYFKLDKRLG